MNSRRLAQAKTQMQRRNLFKWLGFGALFGATNLLASKDAAAASITHSMWVHGVSILCKHPDRLSSMEQYAQKVRLVPKLGTDNNVRFVIPSLVYIDGRRSRLKSVGIKFSTTANSPQTTIYETSVYDGPNQVAKFTEELRGDFSTDMRWKELLLKDQPKIYWGVQISMQLVCKADITGGSNTNSTR